MPSFVLSPQQLNFIETFGYFYFPGLAGDRIDEIIEAFEQVWIDLEVEHPETQRTTIYPFLGQSEYLSSLLGDDRIDGIFSSLLGRDYAHLGSSGIFFVNDTAWHSDTPWKGPVYDYKIGLYLDPLTASTGALRLMPGSHKYGDAHADTLQETMSQLKGSRYWMNTEKLAAVYGLDGPSVPAVAIESQPGDVILFNQGIKHSSWGAIPNAE